MGQPESLAMQAARKLLGEVLCDFDEEHVKRAAEIIAPYFPPEGERPQVVVILEGGTVSSAHSNVPGLDLGIIDCDEEKDCRLNRVTGLKDVVTGEPLDQEVYKTMQQHRANIAAGKLPHQIY